MILKLNNIKMKNAKLMRLENLKAIQMGEDGRQKGKYWRYNYRFQKKLKTLAIGVYPDISLKDACTAHFTNP